MGNTEEAKTTSLSIQTEGLLQYTKSDIKSRISHAKQLVEEGLVDKTEAYIYAKKLEALGKDLATELKPLADDQTIQKGGITLFNAIITQGEQGVKWDYTVTQDSEWLALDAEMKELKAKKDIREKFLQGVTKPLELVDTETGETYTIYPPVKSGSLGLSVKLK